MHGLQEGLLNHLLVGLVFAQGRQLGDQGHHTQGGIVRQGHVRQLGGGGGGRGGLADSEMY